MATFAPDNHHHTAAVLPKRLVLGCGALVHELVALFKQNDQLQHAIDLQCLPAQLHNTPQLIAGEVDKYLQANAEKYDDIFIAYADCGTGGALDRVLLKYNAQRLDGAHCYEFYAGSEAFAAITDAEMGSFFLTDYLVKNFQRLVVEGLGLDRYPELFDEYFKHYTQIVYLAQTEDPKLQEMAKQQAASFGMEYQYRYVGIQGLSPVTQPVLPSVVKRQSESASVLT